MVQRRLLDEDTPNYWTDAELNDHLNNAYQMYYMLMVDNSYQGILASPAVLNITALTNTVALPTDFLVAKVLERVLATQTVPLTYQERYDTPNVTSGASTAYYPTWFIRGTNIVLEPTPSMTAVGGLQLTYWPVPTEMTDDAHLPATGFRTPWHRMIAYKAAILAKGGREESDVSSIMALLAPMESTFQIAIGQIANARTSIEPFVTD